VVSREVTEGLARQKDFVSGFRFVLPVRIRKAQVLRDLADFHFVDVDNDAGMDSLVQSITEDWKGRVARAATTSENSPAR
jgi:hypothetical protein